MPAPHDRPPERPEDVAGQPEGRDAERDGDDQHHGNQAREDVPEGEPPPGEQEPQDVAQGAHPPTLAADRALPPGRRARGQRPEHVPSRSGPNGLTLEVAPEPSGARPIPREVVPVSTPTTPTARLPRQRVSPFDPPPDYRSLQESDPVSPLVFPGGATGWLVTRYDDVRALFADPRFSSRRSFAMNPVRETPEELRPFMEPEPGQFIGLDPPEHTRYRRLLTGQFTVRRMRALEPRITEIVEQQLEGMRRAGPPVRPGRVVRAAGALAGDLRAARGAVRATGRVPAALAAAAVLRHARARSCCAPARSCAPTCVSWCRPSAPHRPTTCSAGW